MQNGNNPRCESPVDLLQVSHHPMILRRVWFVRAIAAKHDHVSGAHIECVVQVANTGISTAGNRGKPKSRLECGKAARFILKILLDFVVA